MWCKSIPFVIYCQSFPFPYNSHPTFSLLFSPLYPPPTCHRSQRTFVWINFSNSTNFGVQVFYIILTILAIYALSNEQSNALEINQWPPSLTSELFEINPLPFPSISPSFHITPSSPIDDCSFLFYDYLVQNTYSGSHKSCTHQLSRSPPPLSPAPALNDYLVQITLFLARRNP